MIALMSAKEEGVVRRKTATKNGSRKKVYIEVIKHFYAKTYSWQSVKSSLQLVNTLSACAYMHVRAVLLRPADTLSKFGRLPA